MFLEHKPGLGSARQDGVAGNAVILMRGSLSAEGMPEKKEKRLVIRLMVDFEVKQLCRTEDIIGGEVCGQLSETLLVRRG